MKTNHSRIRCIALAGAVALALPLAAAAGEPEHKKTGDMAKAALTQAGMKAIPQQAQQIVANWPDESRKAAQAMIKEYGQPDGATSTMLVWNDNGPWNTTIVTNNPIDHNFPMPHKDVLAQSVYYEVPVDRVDELARFDGSVIVDRTKGTLTARCDKQPANFLALNLAHDIATGAKNVEQARQYYARAIQEMMKQNKMDPYLRGLQFDTMTAATAGYPDEVFDQVAMQEQ